MTGLAGLAGLALVLFDVDADFAFIPAALAKNITDSTAGPSQKNYKLGIKAFDRGDYDGCVDAELQSIYFSRNGYQPDAYYWLGKAYQQKGDFPKAYEALTKSTTQAMNNANEAHLSLAQVCTSLKKYQEAQNEQAKAGNGISWGQQMYFRIKFQDGVNLEAWGQPEAACGCYAEAMGKEPWHVWDPWIHMSECLMKLKKWVEAYQQLEKMMTTNQTIKGLNFARVYLDMGICDLAKGNHQGALDNWHKVLEYEPDNKEAHLQLGLLLDSEQHLKSAITEYKYFIRMAGTGDDMRVKQVETRIQLLEQMQGKQDAPPPPVAPSPYMLNQQKKQQQPQPVGDPGF
jgi:tetratricopeptide (TPR) repeat protein